MFPVFTCRLDEVFNSIITIFSLRNLMLESVEMVIKLLMNEGTVTITITINHQRIRLLFEVNKV